MRNSAEMRRSMGKVWKQWFENKGLDKFFRRDNLLILILAGILLVIIALPTADGDGEKSSGEEAGVGSSELSAQTAQSGETGGEPDASWVQESELDYAAQLESRLEDALSNMADVGKVKVMITLKSSRELVVEKETPVSRSSTTETDSQGGSRTVNTSEMGESVVYSTDGSSSEPYVVKSLAPEIEGVLVVAEGAGSGTVNRTVTEIVQALFGVEAHKVMVVKLEE